MRKRILLSSTLAVALLTAASAFAADKGTADEAKAMLVRAVTAVKVDRKAAMAKFADPNGGFKDRDLYVFCFDRTSGIVEVGSALSVGKDVRTQKDPTGKAFGQEMFDKVKDGEILTIDYVRPPPGSTTPAPKESFVEGIGAIACGVGYYK